MPQTALVYHPDFALHRVDPSHPEQPQRILNTLHNLKESPQASNLLWIPAIEAPAETIAYNHTPQHIQWVTDLSNLSQPQAVSADTYACSDTPRIASLGVGSALQAIDLVMQGQAKNAFCAVRPPGHHAESSRAMGFCFFNNIAIAAHYLRHQYNLKRIAILDWDVHHGNGTQNSFYHDPHVFFCSLHQAPHYPGTGAAEETGIGEGLGYTLNIPVAQGSGDADYMAHFRKQIEPAFATYNPEFILISAGFDAHWRDPLGDVRLTTEGFSKLSDLVVEWAGAYCEGRLVSILEGGYDLQGLYESAQVHVNALIDG